MMRNSPLQVTVGYADRSHSPPLRGSFELTEGYAKSTYAESFNPHRCGGHSNTRSLLSVTLATV